MADFDFDLIFDDDYVYFYEARTSAEESEQDADLIWDLLRLEEGMSVLDLCCGYGRIANRLARRGARVTGLDSSERFLELAAEEARRLGVEVEYRRGDMRAIPFAGRFDRVVNWFSSFGYFDDESDRAVLAGACRALREGGGMAVDHINRDWVLRGFQEARLIERDGDLLVDQPQYDALTGRVHVRRTIVRGGARRSMNFQLRLFTYPELRDWLLAAGFARVEGHAGDGSVYGLDGDRMIAVAWR